MICCEAIRAAITGRSMHVGYVTYFGDGGKRGRMKNGSDGSNVLKVVEIRTSASCQNFQNKMGLIMDEEICELWLQP